eukprot:gene8875-9788_t
MCCFPDNTARGERLEDPRLLLGTSEFRGLSPHHQAVKLVNEYHFSHQKAASAVSLTRAAVEGALKADSEGRDLGVVGHPSHLNKEEKQQFLEECQREADNGVPVTYKVAANIANSIQKVHRQQHLETYHEVTPGVARAMLKAHGIRVRVPRPMEKKRLLPAATIREFFDRAAGKLLTPLLILPLKTFPTLSDSVVSAFNLAGSSTGFITGEILKNVLIKGFIEDVKKIRETHGLGDRRALLILDNHSSRNAIIEQHENFEANGIEILFIPAHSSHLLQPLDLGVNLHFKQLYYSQKSKEDNQSQNEDAGTRRDHNLQILADCLRTADSPLPIKTSWERTGLWPINRDVPLRSASVLREFEAILEAVKRKRGQAFGQGRIAFQSRNVSPALGEERENFEPGPTNKKKRERKSK